MSNIFIDRKTLVCGDFNQALFQSNSTLSEFQPKKVGFLYAKEPTFKDWIV